MEKMVELNGQRAEDGFSAEEQIQELSLELLSNVGGGIINVPL